MPSIGTYLFNPGIDHSSTRRARFSYAATVPIGDGLKKGRTMGTPEQKWSHQIKTGSTRVSNGPMEPR